MSVTVVATPGASNANSFQTVAEIDAYYQSRVPVTVADEWLDAAASDKDAAAVMATRVMTASIAWTGYETSASQPLPWPREGMWLRNGRDYVANNAIPQELKDAHAELARILLSTDRTAESDVATQGITSVKAGSVKITFRDYAPSPDVLPDTVIDYLVPSWIDEILNETSMEKELRRS